MLAMTNKKKGGEGRGEGVVDHCASVARVDLSPSACALVCFLIVRSLEGGEGRADWRSQEEGVRGSASILADKPMCVFVAA